MQAFRKTAYVLIFPTIACLGAACDRTGPPTGPPSAAAVDPAFKEDHGHEANTLWVNDDDPNGGLYVPGGTSCNDPGYPTVQSAVNAAAPGDRVNVCAGTYLEQVTVPTGKDGIQLLSVQRWQAVIKAPPVMVAGPSGTFSIVRITGAQNVTTSGFTIAGPGPGPCGTLHYGVRVDEGASARVLGNHITHIRDEPLSGCQNGTAIQVGRLADLTTGSAQITGNVIDDYQKNGPTVSNAGSSAEISNNQVVGIGPTALIAQNGIQVSGGATASVRNNFVAQNIYTPQTVTSTGILLFQSGKVVTEHNTVTANDVGIDLFQAASGSTTRDNRVRGSTFDGIAVDGTNGGDVSHNDVDHNGGPGIGVYIGAQNNRLDNNQVEDNDNSGILLDLASNNVVSRNKVNDNGTDNADMTDGIRINAPSTGNTIRNNRLKRNVTHDCHDGSTGNTWIKNHGKTSFPAGLCDGKNNGDDDENVESSNAFGSDAGNGESVDYDGAAPNTGSLLQLLPTIRTSATRGAVSPDR